MTRFAVRTVVAFALAALPMLVQAEQGGAAQAKTIEVAGTVTTVGPDSLTVKGKPDTWTFTIDKETTVTVLKGATKKNLDLKAAGKEPKLADFVKVGDYVNVGYHETGTTKHAATIRVTASIK